MARIQRSMARVLVRVLARSPVEKDENRSPIDSRWREVAGIVNNHYPNH